MASEEKSEFQRYREIYQKHLQSAMAPGRNNGSSEAPTPNIPSVARVAPQNGSGGVAHVAGGMHAAAPSVGPPVRITEKKTYEEVFKEVLEKRLSGQSVKVEPTNPKTTVELIPTSSNIQEQDYITTIYNITPRELPSTSTHHVPAPGSVRLNTGSGSDGVRKQLTSFSSHPSTKPTMEGISYQKTQPNAYAKQLLNITKSNLHKVTFKSLEAKEAASPRVVVASTNKLPDGPSERKIHNPAYIMNQQDIYRRIQLTQERRDIPNPALKAFTQNAETVMVSKHRSNLMVTIVQPKITSPAPAHVYGAPDISTTQPRLQQPEQYSSVHRESVCVSEDRRVRSVGQVTSGGSLDPPPAHSYAADPASNKTYSTSLSATAAPSVIIHTTPNNNQNECYVQEEVLNLDIKHDTGGSRDVEKQHHPQPQAPVVSVPELAPHTTGLATHLIRSSSLLTKPAPVAKKVQMVPAVPSPPVSNATNNALWQHLQRYNLQQLLAHVQTARQQLLDSNQQPQKQEQAESNQLIAPSGTGADNTMVATPVVYQASMAQAALLSTIPTMPLLPGMAKPTFGDIFFQQIQESALKRKNQPIERDPVKKRRSKPKLKRPEGPFLQNGPCHQVASRLPRCRECGRSAAVRSRNASIIFCRFIAFRKLKYNGSGQLEVAGFADPFLDAKETDTNLWSANLQKVPADLSVEKSKFLLGQVGYKFCELFHQEKEAYFEHMSDDKTIAWKQSVQGVREMCDVCQTTLFNHHWVCSTCGFVVCIDCYKCRKNGIITVDSTTKDKDTYSWLLCSGTKEPHVQERLMMTQIIPGKCLYTLVRQMHGICALLEIPLNCECPLGRESLFRNIKDRLEFIYPVPPDGGYDMSSGGGQVSVTIKQVEQMGVETPYAEGFVGSDPLQCRVVFTQRQCDETVQWSRHNGGTKDEACKEKQSYSFEGFEHEIQTDGDHFDESLYKIPEAKQVKKEQPELGESDKAMEERVESTNGAEIGVVPKTETDLTSFGVMHDSSSLTQDQQSVANGAFNGGGGNDGSAGNALSSHGCQETLDGEAEAMKVEPSGAATNGNGSKKLIDSKLPTVTVPVVPYSEEDRFKVSPPVDHKTFVTIMKQVVKFDKSIFQLLQPHMSGTMEQLDDFVECVSIQRNRVQQFVKDFLHEFIFLRGQNSTDDLTNERLIVEYNQSMKESPRYRNPDERKMSIAESKPLYPTVAHEWLCNGKLLRLLDPLAVHNYRAFHEQWERGQPVMVSAVSSKMDMNLWVPDSFGRDFGEQINDLINCFNGKIVRGHSMKVFWDGFEEIEARLVDERERPMMLKLKDWPPGDDFAEMMPTRFYDLMKSLPLGEYTRREGRLNLASRLCSFFVRPDLGPKMYSAYGSALHPTKGTTNLHLDISDAVNVMVYVGVPKDVPRARYNDKIVELIDAEDCDYLTRQRVRQRKEFPGALWHIYHAQDADKIRALLNKIELERGGTIKPNHDPIHDQKWYLDRNMRKRLQQEYAVEGYAIVQCAGDAIFIPAGAPHQVRNLHNCIKVAEDFVSPENIAHCLKLTNEFRHLSRTHSNHEDKLQIKNIIYHTVKDAVSCISNPLIRMTETEQ
uniref:[histone H3]-dimethyl-L-lysine(9) demethylase n=1 Tax=Anopheles dirus TaxID=7168 RepID=A0A182NR78_9DIPT